MASTIDSMGNLESRRFDVDWLRSLAFILLIFYHIGMFYVYDWGWHVKSEYQSEFLQNLMLMLNRWRMPLIFLISGMALSLVEHKINTISLLKMRFLRVFIPLVIGMYLIVPPQLFYELVQNQGFTGSYWSFWNFYIDTNTNQYPNYNHGPLGLLTWNHLWYLAYLWHYTLVYLLLRPLLNRINWEKISPKIGIGSLFLVTLILITCFNYFLKSEFPKTNALVDDWYNHSIYFSIFALGYLLPKLKNAWEGMIQFRRKFLVGALIGYACTLILHNDRLTNFLYDNGINAAEVGSHLEIIIAIWVIISANVICWLFALVGYAGKYLTRSNRFLRYMNEAVLPWYILHQTLIVIFAMWLAKYSLGPFVEPLLLIALTFTGCFVGYEIIKRNKITRFMFGMKIFSTKKPQKCEQKLKRDEDQEVLSGVSNN